MLCGGKKRSEWQLGTTQKEKCELSLVGIIKGKFVGACSVIWIYIIYVCSARSRMKTKAMAKIVLDKSVASNEDNA